MKETYENPIAQMVEIASEDVICTSGFGNPDNDNDGDDLD